MNVFDKILLEARLSTISKLNMKLSKEIIAYDMDDSELATFAKEDPSGYAALIEKAEELYSLSIEEANIFLQLEKYEAYKIMQGQLKIIEKSMWTIKQAAA